MWMPHLPRSHTQCALSLPAKKGQSAFVAGYIYKCMYLLPSQVPILDAARSLAHLLRPRNAGRGKGRIVAGKPYFKC